MSAWMTVTWKAGIWDWDGTGRGQRLILEILLNNMSLNMYFTYYIGTDLYWSTMNLKPAAWENHLTAVGYGQEVMLSPSTDKAASRTDFLIELPSKNRKRAWTRDCESLNSFLLCTVSLTPKWSELISTRKLWIKCSLSYFPDRTSTNEQYKCFFRSATPLNDVHVFLCDRILWIPKYLHMNTRTYLELKNVRCKFL